MKSMKTTALPALLLAAAAAAAPEVGCVQVPVDGQQPQLATHVQDWRDEVIYQVLVDRYANGNVNNDYKVQAGALARYQGGDWRGMREHLDYAQALGVTTLWISPVVKNVETDADVDAYHGYWAQDLTHTNPHFGDLATLRRMVNELHSNGIKVILDIVTNHMGQLFYYDINGNGAPDNDVYGQGCPPAQLDRGCQNPMITHLTEYDPDYDPRGIQGWTSLGFSGPAKVNWIYLPEIHRMPPMPVELQNKDWWNKRGRIVSYDNENHQPKEQVLTGDFPGGLKDLKTSDPDVQAALTKAYSFWIAAADFDGFRIDTLKHVEHPFWQFFTKGVRDYALAKGKKNFFMFGEAFDGDDQLTGSYTFNNEVDSVFYFPQRFRVFRDVFQTNGPTKAIEDLWNDRTKYYDTTPHPNGPVDKDGNGIAAPQLLVNFLDNHDITRFNFDFPCAGKDNCPALWSALALLLTEQGIPCIYYGTEQEFNGGNDPANRERLWDKGFPTTGKTFRWIKALSDARRKYSPLRHGETKIKWATTRTGGERDAGIIAYERINQDDGKRVLVVINTSDAHPSTTQAPDDLGGGRMSVGFGAGATLVNVLPDPMTGTAAMDTVTVGGDATVTVTLPPRGAKVFVAMQDLDGISPIGGK